MKQCPNCGKTHDGGHAFCTSCGAALMDAPPPTPGPEEPTILIPPIQPPEPPHPPAGDPFATGPVPIQTKPPVQAPVPPQPPAKKAMVPAAAAIVLAVCTVLAACCAGFVGYQALQLKKNYEAEQRLRIAAEQSASGIQEELDKLRLNYDQQANQLEEASTRNEDYRSQLEDVSGQLTDGSSQLNAVEKELSDLIGMLSGSYGFASPSYYASRGVVVVRQNSSQRVTIYEDTLGDTTFSFEAPGYGVNCAWDGESFSNGRNSVTITGLTEGYYTISFTNDYDGDAFEILVIVTE